MDIQNNEGIAGIALAIILAGIIITAGVAASVILGGSDNGTEEDYEQILNEALDEISTYIQIKDMVGKFYSIDGEKRIQRIALLIKPLFSIDIDVSELTIKLNNGKQISMLYYDGNANFINVNPLFEHPVWNEQNENNFGFIVILDKDESLVNHSIINENTDMAYITIKLPEDFELKKGDSMQITLFPSTGITRTIEIKAPAPVTSIVNLR